MICRSRVNVYSRKESNQNTKTIKIVEEVICEYYLKVLNISEYKFVEEDHSKLSEVWETVVLSLIGESLDDGDNITGARVVDKSNPYKKQINHRIEIWFREWKDEEFRKVLKERMEGILRENGMEGREITFYQNDYSKWK